MGLKRLSPVQVRQSHGVLCTSISPRIGGCAGSDVRPPPMMPVRCTRCGGSLIGRHHERGKPLHGPSDRALPTLFYPGRVIIASGHETPGRIRGSGCSLHLVHNATHWIEFRESALTPETTLFSGCCTAIIILLGIAGRDSGYLGAGVHRSLASGRIFGTP